MPRTTEAAVRAIINVKSTITSLDPYIETANAIVTAVCEGSTDTYTTAQLELIERWLSAHFYAVHFARATAESAGSVQAIYESKVDLGLMITRYGQQAIALDVYGNLAVYQQNIVKGRKRMTVGVSYLGTSPDSVPQVD